MPAPDALPHSIPLRLPWQMDRFQQTEERLQSLLAVSQKQSEAGMRLSSKDWSAFRKRLMRLWALR